MKNIAFFNNKGGVGTTSLVYHLAWMFADHGVRVLVADLDPQSNLTSMFLDEERLSDLWDNGERLTIYDCLQPLMERTGDIAEPYVERVAPDLGLLPGNLFLSHFEALLAETWPKCMDSDTGAFRIQTAFHRLIERSAMQVQAELVLIDVGPSLGAINRSALIAAQQVILPLAPDLFSLQGLKNLCPTLREWRKGWSKRKDELPEGAGISLPEGDMQPAGYVVMQHGIRGIRPVKAYQNWLERIPGVYRESILQELSNNAPDVEQDPYNLALLKHYRSLMPLAMDARKPMFFLRPADGAIGAHVEAVRICYQDFRQLASRIAAQADISLG